MKAIQTIDTNALHRNWQYYLMAYKIHNRTQNDKIKAVCSLIACSYQGVIFCKEHGHTYTQMDLIDKQILKEEYNKLKQEGIIK